MAGERTARNSHLPAELLKLMILFSQQSVSRSWLYSQPDIRTEIQQLRDATQRTSSPPVPAAQRASDTSLPRWLQAAGERNRQLTEDNKRLRHQFAEALGQLRAPGHPRSLVTIRPC